MTTMDYIVDVIGFTAACLVASSLLAQIWRAHALQSALDLSYAWQVTVGAGIFLQLIYLGHYEQWSVFVPLSCELVFMLYLLGLKLFFEQNLFGLGRGGRKADVGAPKLGEHLLDGVDDSTGGGGAGDRNGPGAEAARQNGGAGVDYERLDGAENGRPTALEPQ